MEPILPDLKNVRVSGKPSYSEGIIIMGYDEEYIDRLTHDSIVFTKAPIEEIALKTSGIPENIVYRTDEIFLVAKGIFPYYLCYIVLSVLISIALVMAISKEVGINYKRLVILGFEKNKLEKAYSGLVYKTGFFAVIIAYVVSIVVSLLFAFCFVEEMVLFITATLDLTTLSVTTEISKKKLWGQR